MTISFGRYSKSIVAVIAAILVAINFAYGDGDISNVEWITIAIQAVGAAQVFAAPNVPGAPVTKTVLAVMTAILTTLVTVIVGGISPQDWVTIGIAVVSAIGVYNVSNGSNNVIT